MARMARSKLPTLASDLENEAIRWAVKLHSERLVAKLEAAILRLDEALSEHN